MSPIKIYTCLIRGLEGNLVEVEADIQRGISAFTIVGLGDQSVQESKERIRTAIRGAGAEYPTQKKIINLAPASLKKQGPVFDLPIAIGLLAASGQINSKTSKYASFLKDTIFIGELALNGELRSVPNVISIALFAQEHGFRRLVVPAENYVEAALVDGLEIIAPENLGKLLKIMKGDEPVSTPVFSEEFDSKFINQSFETRDSAFLTIHGQEQGKRAILLAAAGGHHLLMQGPPGIGKTMLAKAIIELLPPLTDSEFFETLRIYSAAKLPTDRLYRRERPFRQIHQTSSLISLTGGGNPITPGEISLAHHGVLFLDEFPEFQRCVIESLRQPLEDRRIYLARQGTQVSFPAKFTLIAAMNPCPCGFYGERYRECSCTPYQIQQYRNKLSGPIFDRIDLKVGLSRPEIHTNTLLQNFSIRKTTVENIQKLRMQVQIAHERQMHRFKNSKFERNSDLNSGDLRRFIKLDEKAERYMEILDEKVCLSARASTQLLRIALTVTDLKNKDYVGEAELSEAYLYKTALY